MDLWPHDSWPCQPWFELERMAALGCNALSSTNNLHTPLPPVLLSFWLPKAQVWKLGFHTAWPLLMEPEHVHLKVGSFVLLFTSNLFLHDLKYFFPHQFHPLVTALVLVSMVSGPFSCAGCCSILLTHPSAWSDLCSQYHRCEIVVPSRIFKSPQLMAMPLRTLWCLQSFWSIIWNNRGDRETKLLSDILILPLSLAWIAPLAVPSISG